MNHYSEEILHLYLLGSPDVNDQRKEIGEHLSGCVGCRSIVADLAQFHQIAEGTSPRLVEHVEEKTSMVVRPEYVQTAPTRYGGAFSSYPQRMWNYARRRPVVSSISGIGFIAVILIALNNFRPDDRPEYFLVNRSQGTVAVYSKTNDMLWSLPVRSIMETTSNDELASFDRQSLLTDINGDGKKEFLTFYPLGNDTSSDEFLHVYDNRGKLRRTIPMPSPSVHFRGSNYETPFRGSRLLLLRTMGNGKEIFAVGHNTRSPMCLIRFDGQLHELGKYWHYGQFQLTAFDADGNGRNDIVIYGMDDVGDMKGHDFTAFGILDPEKITREGESSATRGFGFQGSAADEYYVRFAETDIERVTNTKALVKQVEDINDSTFSVDVRLPDYPVGATIQYLFDKKSMRVVDTKYSPGVQRYHSELKQKGRLHSTFDRQYLENLRNGVQYWNGSEWQLQPTRVRVETSQ